MNRVNKSDSFVKSALIISIGGLLAKILGAVYRIPLTNLLGSYGMGLYQLVFPPYILILILSCFGIPITLSKLLSEQYAQLRYDKAEKLFSQARFILLITGFAGAAALFIAAPYLAAAQNTPEIASAYRLIAPSILFVCLTGAYRGYFQGNMNMLPVSFSQVAEQAVKLVIGLSAAKFFMPDCVKAVCACVCAVTISEAVTLVITASAYAFHRRNKYKVFDKCRQSFGKEIFSLAFPVVVGGFIMQLVQLLDSVMVVNILNDAATSAYGLWTGPVNSMLGFPVALTGGVAVSALPALTRTVSNGEQLQSKYCSAVKLTLAIALPSAIGLAVLAEPVMRLLYATLPAAEIKVATTLMMISAPAIVFLSLLQTLTAALQALGKPYVAVLSLGVCVAVKLLFNLILLPLPSVNIYGAAASESLCYGAACVVAALYLRFKAQIKLDGVNSLLKPIACCTIMTTGLLAITLLAPNFANSGWGTLLAIGLCVVLYGACIFALKVFSQEELGRITKSRRNSNDGKTSANAKNPIT